MDAQSSTSAVGESSPATVPERRGSDYAELSRRVRAAGLLQARPGYYAAKMTVNALLLGACVVAFVRLGDSWLQLVTATFLAVVSTQVAYVGHDAGHRQIARSRRWSYLLGLLHGNLAVGLSFGWWVDKHNRHHAHPNDVERDPDVRSGALAFTTGQASLRRGVGRWLTRIQATLFLPMLLLEGLHLHVASVRALLSGTVRSRWLEASLLLVHAVAYLGAVFLVLSPMRAVAFLAVHQALFGLYMGVSFAPNHKGMPAISASDDADYLRRQVLTSRNIRGGRVVDTALGGLNYQIEHHLFPSLPRPSLRRAQPLVRAFCAERGVRYAETTFLGSYAEVFRHLHAVGRPLRATGRARVGAPAGDRTAS